MKSSTERLSVIDPFGGKSLANNDNHSVSSEFTIDFEEIFNCESSEAVANIAVRKGDMQTENPCSIEISVSASTVLSVNEIDDDFSNGDEKGKYMFF